MTKEPPVTATGRKDELSAESKESDRVASATSDVEHGTTPTARINTADARISCLILLVVLSVIAVSVSIGLVFQSSNTDNAQSDVDEPPVNDLCQGAISLKIDEVVQGTTVDATNDHMTKCGVASVQRSPGVWYTFVGNGTIVNASTCHGDASVDETLTNTQIKVYAGNNCSALECITGNDHFDYFGCGLLSSVGWTALEGVEYYILVHGGRWGEKVGSFGLVVTQE